MVFITAVHMHQHGNEHEHIAEVRWRNPDDGATGASTREVMVDWIQHKNGKARVTDGYNTADVGIVNAQPPYLRTHADGRWTNNLLALPRY